MSFAKLLVLVRPWCRAVKAAATRTKTIVGRGDGTSQLRQLGIAGRKTQPERGRRLHLGRPSAVVAEAKEREGSRGAERRWRGDQAQVDSRRENVCACSSAVGEYATSKFSNFSEKGKLTFCVASFFFCSSSPKMVLTWFGKIEIRCKIIGPPVLFTMDSYTA